MTSPNHVVPQSGKAAANQDRCPWCKQTIAHEKFEAIKRRIAAEERERSAKFERELRERTAHEKTQIQAAAQAQVALTKQHAAAAIDQAAKAVAARETAARAEGKQAAESALAARIASAEAAKQKAESALTSTKESAESVLAERLRQQREAFEKAGLEAINAEKAKAFTGRQKLEEKLATLQRQLQQKTADELGEGAEVDLYETLRREFPDDRFTRVKNGTPGADIIHEILQHGRVRGQIVYDAKNRDAWRNDYVTKLRQDQLAARADHAVLASRAFPAGAHQIHLQDGVIVANPARVLDLVRILRRQALVADRLRLAGQARQEKTTRLYAFITSDRCRQLLDEIDTVADDLLQVDVKEVKAHEATWKQRGHLIRSVQRARGSLVAEVDQIIGIGTVEQSA